MRRLSPTSSRCSTLVLLLGACNADDGGLGPDPAPPELPFEYTSEHLVIHSDIELCAGDFARWDGFVEFAATYLDMSPPEEPLELYVWQEDGFDAEAVCGHLAGGCFHKSTGTAYASWQAVEHELVHSLTRDYATKDSFFIEGLADALARPTAFGHTSPTFPLRGSGEVEYGTAGHFVRWLLETRGTALLVEHMEGSGSVAQFEQIYGSELPATLAEYYASAIGRYSTLYQYPMPTFQVEAQGVWSSELDFSCTHVDVRATAEGLMVVRELTILESGYYAFWSSTGGIIRGRGTTYPENEADFDPGFASGFSFPANQIGAGPIPAGTYELGIVAAPGVESGVVKVWKSETTVPTWPESPP